MADSTSPDLSDMVGASVEALASALFCAWSVDTSSLWTPENQARGQCGVTSLVVQDLFGGEILKTHTPDGMHFYNRVNGRRVDLTQAQFKRLPRYDDLPATRDDALADTSPGQYQALRRNLGLLIHGAPDAS